MNEEKKKKTKITGISIGILVVLLVVISSTYAYWQITRSQDGSNDIIAACLDIDMESVDGTFALNPAWPISDDEGKKLEGYTFKVTNNCEEDVNYVIGMDSLVKEGVEYLDYNGIKISIDNSASIIYGEQEDIEHNEKNDSYQIRDSKKIATSVVKNGQPNEHVVKVWIKSDAPVSEQSKGFSGRIFIIGGQNIENDKTSVRVIATGDMSRTENDNVKYTMYSNGDLIISGTGATKDYDGPDIITGVLNKFLEFYDIELTEDEQKIIEDPTLFTYFGLAWYGKEFFIDFKTNGAYKTREDFINYVKTITQYGDAFESLVNKTKHFKIKNVVVEDGITSIGVLGLNALMADNIYISDSVVELKDGAFNSMAAENLRLSENLKFIDAYVFENLALLSKTLYIPNSVESIPNQKIFYNSNIETIKLPRNNKFTHLSASMYSAGSNTKISTIIIPETITSFSSMDGTAESKITLKFIGPERSIYLGQGGLEEYDLSIFKEVIWNYTE